jgi:hypothetical protein
MPRMDAFQVATERTVLDAGSQIRHHYYDDPSIV